MTEKIDLNLKCNDCKFYDGYCKIYGLNTPKVCEDFTIKDDDSLLGGVEDFI